jgi:hypothetical protein
MPPSNLRCSTFQPRRALRRPPILT